MMVNPMQHFTRALRSWAGRTVPVTGFLALLIVIIITAPAAEAKMNIQEVTSPGGIKAWLVESRQVPLIAMRFSFTGGAAQDPRDKDGLANFVSGMLDEGAGSLSSEKFQERQEDLALRMSFNAGRDMFTGSFQTLKSNADEAAKLLHLALSKPRFDTDAVDRIKKQILTGLKFDMNDPRRVASLEWFKLAFKDHPYSRPVKGTMESVKRINRDDLNDFVAKVFTKDGLSVAVVGDIDAKTLGPMLDKIFGKLPKGSDIEPIAEAKPPTGPQRKVIEMNVPQSVAVFGHSGFKRKDEDFIASYILNYILGGGGFNSRLTEEVREKRGLAYSIYSYLSPYRRAAIYLGNVATETKSMTRSLKVIRDELRRMADKGPSAEELKNAKQYLTGSYALRFDTSSKIANQLLWIQIENLGKDYIDTRNASIEAVTLADVRRVAKRLLKADGLIVTIVGKPSSIETKPKKS
jgi:zinc protease